MYLGVDVGGTKTLVTVLNSDGVIRERTKFPTPKSYNHFLLELRHALAHFKTQEFQAAGVGIPVTVFDRKHGRGVNFGNLPWRNVPIQLDMEHICKCPVVIENDAKMAALSEATLIKDRYRSVLYVTVSTGIGIGLVVDGKIDANVGDGGGRAIVLENKGKLMPWEDFASGRAIVETYKKRAMDIEDKATWQKICRNLAKGIVHLIALTEPEVIVIGGSVGTYFDRYGSTLKDEIKKYHLPLVPIPDIVAAQRPEEAVVYGCYDLAKQRFPHHAKATA
jgi:glucokinase